MSLGDMNALLALLITIAGLIAGWWRWGRHKWAKWRQPARDREQLRENMWAAIPGMIEDAKALRSGIESLNEREGALTAQFKALSSDVQRVAHIASDTLAMKEMDFEWSVMPKFICDPQGRNLRVNRAYFQTIGVSREDLMGFGYRSFIVREDLGPYLARAMAAIAEHRNHTDRVRFITADGPKAFEVNLLPHPPYADMGPLERIVGTMEPVEAGA